MNFSQMTPQEVVTLLRVAWGKSDTDYDPSDAPLADRLENVVLAHLDDIAASDHDRAKQTLETFTSSPLPADRINAFALLVSLSSHTRDGAMPYWERLMRDANEHVRGYYEGYLDDYLHDHKGSEDDLIGSVGLSASDVHHLLELSEQAEAESKLIDLGQLAVEKLIATQPTAPSAANSAPTQA
jgi:hypothetical protein